MVLLRRQRDEFHGVVNMHDGNGWGGGEDVQPLNLFPNPDGLKISPLIYIRHVKNANPFLNRSPTLTSQNKPVEWQSQWLLRLNKDGNESMSLNPPVTMREYALQLSINLATTADFTILIYKPNILSTL